MRTTGFRAWQGGLLATSALAAALFAAIQIWHQGHPEWAFITAFFGVWALVSIILSSLNFTDRSAVLLATIVDENFEQMHNRVRLLEDEIRNLRSKGAEQAAGR